MWRGIRREKPNGALRISGQKPQPATTAQTAMMGPETHHPKIGAPSPASVPKALLPRPMRVGISICLASLISASRTESSWQLRLRGWENGEINLHPKPDEHHEGECGDHPRKPDHMGGLSAALLLILCDRLVQRLRGVAARPLAHWNIYGGILRESLNSYLAAMTGQRHGTCRRWRAPCG